MLKFFIAFLFAFQTNAKFPLKNNELSDFSFKRYIKPQVRSILQDYFSLFKFFNENSKNSYPMLKTLQDEFQIIIEIKQKCPDYLSTTCSDEIFNLKEKMKVFEKELLLIQEKITCSSLNLENCFGQSYSASIVQDEVSKFLGQLEQVALFVHKVPHHFSTKELSKSFNQIHFFFTLFQVKLLEKKYHEIFLSVFQFYIHPMNLWFQTDFSNKEFLLKNLNEFNSSWNAFNFNMTKKLEKETPRPVLLLVKTMHNRWNSILRVILQK